MFNMYVESKKKDSIDFRDHRIDFIEFEKVSNREISSEANPEKNTQNLIQISAQHFASTFIQYGHKSPKKPGKIAKIHLIV